ncbi:amine sulfotransferase-like [Stegodyphus dumicola]|uniref:amine sulfotransferase-like n=1 Tax=Stegodyphus dumicola TaxID=202533 RepID=UPI0015AAD4CB|nr:amine sulfotransferase-like [Stegodyphus dumicola]XP_035234094.1 amine sulfotransferase-like [Stegodyphus dumicola]
MSASSTSVLPLVQVVDGLPMSKNAPIENIRSALSYIPRDDDVFIATYPKCGTTWAQQMLILIFRHGKPLESFMRFGAVSPFLDMAGVKAVEEMPRPNAIKTHLPYHLAPHSVKAKYIYVTRNPKDCCVSYFHHTRDKGNYEFNGTFDDFFELFLSGNVEFGDYFDHLLSWYYHRNDPNMLFLTYEQMKEDPSAAILKMASFIDDDLYAEPLRNDPEKLRDIVKFSSFDYMKEATAKVIEEIKSMTEEDIAKSELPGHVKKFFSRVSEKSENGFSKKKKFDGNLRKGITGDWKNYFSEDQSKRMEEKFAEKTKGTDLQNLWKDYI